MMQVFHVCESGQRQSSFLCPRGTIFNQKHRVCDWWYNVKCEDSTEFYDLNLDLLLLEKGVSPTQATNLNIPPPIDPLASFGQSLSGSLPLDLLGGSDAELDSLILDDLVLSNLLSGNRRMDTGDSDHNSMMLDQLIGATNSPISNRLPSAVAAPVQPQPTRSRKRKRKKRPSKRKSSSGGGGGSLCQIMNICDSIPAPPPSFNRNQFDLMSAPSEFQPSIVPAPKSLRMDEKSAAEIAALYQADDLPRRSHQIEDSIPAASSYSNSLSIPQVSISLPNFEVSESLNYDQNFEGQVDDTNIGIPEEYRMTHFGKDVLTLKNHSNVPVTFINFDDFEERRSKMIPDSPASEQNVEENSTTTEKNFKLKNSNTTTEKDFKLKDYNVDQDARTWSPMRMTGNGKIERTDLSKPLDQSDWIPKLGPDTNIRET